MSLPLFHCPGSFSFLDDDPDYLQMLALILPDHWNVRLHTHVDDCLGLLQQESAVWEDDAWTQQQIVDRWRQGATPLLPQVLAYWAGPARVRYGLTHACIVDYSMPQMNGLDALAALSDWPGLRVLLTGQADEEIAVDAFNRALIDQFLPKQDVDVAARLLGVLRHMPSNANTRASQIWRGTLTPVQNAQLRVPSTARALQQLLEQHGFVEHVVLGDPFGILGRSAAGAVGWLQLEPMFGLEELEQLAQSAGMGPAALSDIRHGRKLVDLELGQALGRGTAPRMQPAFAIGHDASLLGALFPLDAAHAPPADSSYGAWLARQPERQVKR